MSSTENPACPKCGRTDGKTISSTPQYRATDRKREYPYATMHVVQCECGLAFTVTTQIEPEPADVP